MKSRWTWSTESDDAAIACLDDRRRGVWDGDLLVVGQAVDGQARFRNLERDDVRAMSFVEVAAHMLVVILDYARPRRPFYRSDGLIDVTGGKIFCDRRRVIPRGGPPVTSSWDGRPRNRLPLPFQSGKLRQ